MCRLIKLLPLTFDEHKCYRTNPRMLSGIQASRPAILKSIPSVSLDGMNCSATLDNHLV